MDVSDRRRIVILGKTGVGKSSLANTIFGDEKFKINHSFNSETTECQAETKSVNGRRVTLIDTPGFFDTHKSEEELKPAIVRCIIECAPGPHAFLIVLKVERFTEQEQDIINKIHQYFSDEVFKYATVLFTHGDQLPEGMKIQEFVRQNTLTSDLVKKCGGRCHVIDNKYWNGKPNDEYRSNQFQVKELLNTIDKITEANNGRCYTNEMLQAVEEKIQQEGEQIRLLPGNKSEEEIRELAKGRAFGKLLIKLAGIAVGVLLGALCGGLMGTLEALMVPGAAGVIIGKSAVVAAVAGGVLGYRAAEGAETPLEAAKRAAESVLEVAKTISDKATDALNIAQQLKKNLVE